MDKRKFLERDIKKKKDEFTKINTSKSESAANKLEQQQQDYLLKNGKLLMTILDDNLLKKQSKKNMQNRSKTIDQEQTTVKNDLIEKYVVKNNPKYIRKIQNKEDEYCPRCHEYREQLITEALLICPSCLEEVSMIINPEKPSYADNVNESNYYAYMRINHFKERLTLFQAKETTKIPQDVLDMIIVEMKRERKNNLAELTRDSVYRYLNKYTCLEYNKYYENINQIINRLNGIPPITISPELQEQMCAMFAQLEEPFAQFRPDDRKNFISYSYVIHKLFQILGHTKYLPHFPLLRSPSRLWKQDQLWRKICMDLGWPFYSSI